MSLFGVFFFGGDVFSTSLRKKTLKHWFAPRFSDATRDFFWA